MNEPSSPDEVNWNLTTFEGGRREQIRRWSELTFDEILRAQEEMANIATEFAAVKFRKPPTTSNS